MESPAPKLEVGAGFLKLLMAKLGYETKVGEDDLYLAIEVSSATAGCCFVAAVLIYMLWILLGKLRACLCKEEDPMEKAFDLMGRCKGERIHSSRWARRRLPSFYGSSRCAPRPPPRMTSFAGEKSSTSSEVEEDQRSTASQETLMLNPGRVPTLQTQGFTSQDGGQDEASVQTREGGGYSVPTPPLAPGLYARFVSPPLAPSVQCSPAGSSGAVQKRPVLGSSFSDQIREAQHKMLTRSRSVKK